MIPYKTRRRRPLRAPAAFFLKKVVSICAKKMKKLVEKYRTLL